MSIQLWKINQQICLKGILRREEYVYDKYLDRLTTSAVPG